MRALSRAVVVTMSLAPLIAAPQQRPTFRSTASGVLVNAFVLSATSAGAPSKFVDGLTARDFVLTDNGTRQDISVSRGDGPVDVTLVVDGGGDAAPYAGEMRQMVRNVATRLRPVDRLRVLACTGVVREIVPMQAPNPVLALEGIGERDAPYGSTLLHGLFDAMVREADPERRSVVIVVGTFSGRDVFGPGALVSTAASTDAVVSVLLEPSGTPVFPDTFQALGRVVAATGGAMLIRSGSQGRVLPPSFLFSPRARGASGGATVVTFKDLAQATSIVLGDLDHGYVLSYSPPGGTAPGWHEIHVSLVFPGPIVRARQRYFATSN